MYRASIAVLVVLAGCGDTAVQMTLLLPMDRGDYDPACVTAVDVLPIANGDKLPADLSSREDAIPCIDISKPEPTFAKLAAAMANKIDLPLPPGGLSAVAVRGREGTCDETPAKHEAIFYGGATYAAGTEQLPIKLARGLNCNPSRTIGVKAVDMIALFTDPTHACSEYTDPGATLVTGEVRPTLVPDRPVVLEHGSSTAPLTSGATLEAFVVSWNSTCPALGLTSATKAGLTCLTTPPPPTACAGAATELAVMPASYASDSVDAALANKYSGVIVVGVWSATGTVGPLAGAQITFDDGDDALAVYGALGTGKLATTGATTTDETGGALVYANGVVHMTVKSADAKMTQLYVGAAPDAPSAVIAVIQ